MRFASVKYWHYNDRNNTINLKGLVIEKVGRWGNKHGVYICEVTDTSKESVVVVLFAFISLESTWIFNQGDEKT